MSVRAREIGWWVSRPACGFENARARGRARIMDEQEGEGERGGVGRAWWVTLLLWVAREGGCVCADAAA